MKIQAVQKISALLFVSLLVPALVNAEPFQPYIEQRNHSFDLEDLQGRIHANSDYRGKVVLINFWASWCTPCIYEMPEFIRLKKELAEQPFEILAVNVGESKNRVKQFVKSIHFDLPVLLDTNRQVFKDWGVVVMPTSYLIDANGKIRYRARGNPGWDQQPTLDVIHQLLTEKVNSQ